MPMYEPTYWSTGSSIHSFLMFVPFFILKKNMIIQGSFGVFPYRNIHIYLSVYSPNLSISFFQASFCGWLVRLLLSTSLKICLQNNINVSKSIDN